jgi:Fur family transcriptional regulator, ferric uptake regulator
VAATGNTFPFGGRLTPQRRAVADALAAIHGRFTVIELHERAQQLRPRLGLATTYRTLELLRESGAVRLLAGEHGPSYIRCHPGHHHHLVCVGCGDVQETELCAAPAAEEIRDRHGFEPEAHDVEIYGRCARCAA